MREDVRGLTRVITLSCSAARLQDQWIVQDDWACGRQGPSSTVSAVFPSNAGRLLKVMSYGQCLGDTGSETCIINWEDLYEQTLYG